MTENRDELIFADCGARPFLDQVANKWTIMILTILCKEPQRFNAILHRLEGVTHKALTQALRRLERNGLVTRRVIASSPVAVEYSITPLGRTLQQPFMAIYQWAVDYLPEIEKAQHEFDNRALG